jgi:hypothetical protein
MEKESLNFWEFDPLEETEDLELVQDPTAGWCDLVSEYYGNHGYKVVITADSFMRLKPTVGSMSGHKRFTIEKTLDDDGNDDVHAFYGEFHGLELRPDTNTEQMHNYILFANMGKVVDLNTDIEISPDADHDLLIPIRDTRSLLLMRY